MDEYPDANRGSYAERAIQKREFLRKGVGVAKRVYAPLQRPFTPIRGNIASSEHQEPTMKQNSKSAPMPPTFKAPPPAAPSMQIREVVQEDENEDYGEGEELQSVTTLVPPPRSLSHMPAQATNLSTEDFELEEFEALESQITKDIGRVGMKQSYPPNAHFETSRDDIDDMDEADFTFHSSRPQASSLSPPLNPSEFLAEEEEEEEVEYGFSSALQSHRLPLPSFPPSLFSHQSHLVSSQKAEKDIEWDDSASFVDQRPPAQQGSGFLGSRRTGEEGKGEGEEEGEGEDQGATQPFVRSLFLQRHRQQKQQQQQHYATAILQNPPSNPLLGNKGTLLTSSSSLASGPSQPFHTTQSIKAQASLSFEVQQRVKQLDEELSKVAAEKSSLVKMRTELEKAASRLEQERASWERRQGEEVARMEEWKAGEMSKIQRERRVLEKQVRA